jgi:hypothetical protein
MKTNRRPILITAILGLAAFSTVGCAKEERTAAAPPPPAKDVAATTATTAAPGPATTVPVAANSSPAAIATEWLDIKDCTYDMRAQFFAGLNRLEAKVDAQISELTAKRAAMAMKSTTDTRDWDFAMKEMENARSALKSMGDVLNRASRETWDQEKDRVGQAWVRTQEAYDKVKSSTTG